MTTQNKHEAAQANNKQVEAEFARLAKGLTPAQQEAIVGYMKDCIYRDQRFDPAEFSRRLTEADKAKA